MKYILIHGIGNQDSENKWFEEAIAATCNPQDYVPFYWEDLREPPLERWLQWARLPFTPFVFIALSGLFDVLNYTDTVYKALSRLDNLLDSIDDDIVLVGHSLGSVLAYQWCIHNHDSKVQCLVTLGSPIGRKPVSTKLKVLYGQQLPLLPKPWFNVAGTKDYVTSWIGGGRIKEASYNEIVKGQSHDLNTYLARISDRVIRSFIDLHKTMKD